VPGLHTVPAGSLTSMLSLGKEARPAPVPPPGRGLETRPSDPISGSGVALTRQVKAKKEACDDRHPL